MPQSTAPSIGCIISGTEHSPAAVGSHFETAEDSASGDRATAKRDARTIALIVAPGIATDARDCQRSASNEAAAARVSRDADSAVHPPVPRPGAGDQTRRPAAMASQAQYPKARA